MTDIIYSQWRAQSSAQPYPFSDRATLANFQGIHIPNDWIIDCILYSGPSGEVYLSAINATEDTVTIEFSDETQGLLSSASLQLGSLETDVAVIDVLGNTGGMLIVNPNRTEYLARILKGNYNFLPEETALVSSVCVPAPLRSSGVAFQLQDGQIVSGDVVFLAEDGVQFEYRPGTESDPETGSTRPTGEIVVHAVGKPLAKRDACFPESFIVPRFFKEIVFQLGSQNISVYPDAAGNISILSTSQDSGNALRVINRDGGVTLELFGESLTNGNS